jgi:hypothetical protein
MVAPVLGLVHVMTDSQPDGLGPRYTVRQVEPGQIFPRINTFDTFDEAESFCRRKRRTQTVFRVFDRLLEHGPRFIGSSVI